MIRLLNKVLNKIDCIAWGDEEKITIDYKNSPYPEDCVQMVKESNLYKIMEVHRNRKNIIIETENSAEACVFVLTLSKRLFGNDINREHASIIGTFADEGKEDDILKFLKIILPEEYYSIGHEQLDKISFIKKETGMDVKYAGEYIVQDASFSRGYVILYNFSMKLKSIDEFYKNELIHICDDIDFMQIAKVYLYLKI